MLLPRFVRIRRNLVGLAAVWTATLLLGCNVGDSFTPSIDNVAGNYTATMLTTTTGGTTTDHLAAGASFTINLAANGTTTGRLFVAGGGDAGGDLDADMAGTWTLVGSTVTFNQTADTFVRDMSFTAQVNHLRGEATFGGSTTLCVTLGK